MKTLKITAILFVGLLIANTSSAQKGAYANFNLGYNFSLNSDVIGTNTNTAGTVNTEENITGSFGKGLNIGGTFGMMFSDNVGAELGINYLMGGTFESTSTLTYATSTIKRSAKMLQINPSFVLSTGKTEGLNPYAKFGIVIGSMGKITREGESNNITNTDPNTGVVSRGTYVLEMTGGISLGWSAGVGAVYSFNEKLGLFGELNMVNMSWAPNKSEFTESTIDGIDKLAGTDTYFKESVFVDQIDYNKVIANSSPREQLKTNYSFSSLGIKIGLRFQF